MKQLYSKLLLVLFLSGTFYIANGQVYWATLSGPAEAPPNNSPGTGSSLVTIDVAANTMRVQATFSGLLAGVTASHIHGPTAVAGAGTAGVATAVPTFPGFPSGVTFGTYDQTFNMLLASSYNPSFMTNNGGTPASAFAALRAAIAAGKAYLNIHSSMFPGGEIRGFLTECPAINVSIPDAFALASGTAANTVYPAYAPASSITLQSNVTGGMQPYSYTWSNMATTSSITVSPTMTTTYNLAVRDQNGCPGTASKTVHVANVSGGNKNDKIVICHKGNSLTIGSSGVADHLQHGDMLGGCEPGSARSPLTHVNETGLQIDVLGNPSPTHFTIRIKSNSNSSLTVYDNMGRVIEKRSSLNPGEIIRLGANYRSGIYLVEIIQGSERQTLKLVKIN